MTTKNIIGLMLIVIFLPLVLAENIDIDNETFENNTTQTKIQTFNEIENELETNTSCEEDSQRTCEILAEVGIVEGVNVPFILPKNSVLNIYFSNEDIIGYVIIESGILSELVCCEKHPQPTHNIKISNFEIIEEIKESENPLKEANKKLNQGDINISAEKFVNKAKLSIGKALIKIASWFN